MDAEVEANLERAEQSLAAARILLEEGYFDDACSRAYYSTYHASTAALLAAGLRFSKHSGVVSGVHRYFVKEGHLPRELGRELSWLFDLRLVGDYGEIRHVPGEEAERAVSVAEQLVEALRGIADEIAVP